MPLLSVDDVEVLLSAVVAAMAPSTLVRASCRTVIQRIADASAGLESFAPALAHAVSRIMLQMLFPPI